MTIRWLALAGVSLAFGLGLTGCKQASGPPAAPPPAPQPPVHIFAAHDSPVTVEGGSVHSQYNNQQGWTKVSNKHYTTTTTNYNQIFGDGITWDTPLPPSMATWTINISTANKSNAVTITTDAGCSPDAPCTLHLQTEPGSRWHVNKRNQLRYHDKTCDGASDTSTGEDSDCDFFQTVSITYTAAGTTGTSNGTCNDPDYGAGYCMIGVGKP